MIPLRNQRGVTAIIAVVLIVLFALIGAYMSTLSTIGSLNTTLSLGSMQAWFTTRSGAEWAINQALDINRICTCGTDCCTTGTSGTETNINGAVLNFTAGGADGFRTTISCGETSVTEAPDTYCVFDLSATAERGSAGDITYILRTINLSVTDAP